MNKFIKSFVFVVLIASKALCVSEAGAVFLLINPGASAQGTGEAQVAKADDAYASYYNPAGLGFLKGNEIVFQHVNWLPNLANDIYFDFIASTLPPDLTYFLALSHCEFVIAVLALPCVLVASES